MKLQVTNKTEELIQGYRHGNITANGIDLSAVADNECEEILASEVLNYFPLEGSVEVIQSLVKKLRMGGHMVIGGTSIRLFCKHVVSGQIAANDASRIIQEHVSMTDVEQVKDAVTKMGLAVVYEQSLGIHYHLKVARG